MSKNYRLRNPDIRSLPTINGFLEVFPHIKDDFYQFVKDELNINEQLVNPKSLSKLLYDKYVIDIECKFTITWLYFYDKTIIKDHVFRYISLKDGVNDSIPLEHMVSKEEMKGYFDKEYTFELYNGVEWDELEKLTHEEIYNKLNDVVNDFDYDGNRDGTTSRTLQADINGFRKIKPLTHEELENIKYICKNILKEDDHTIFLLTDDLKIIDKIEEEVVLNLFIKFVSKNQERFDGIVENYTYSVLKELFVKPRRTRLL